MEAFSYILRDLAYCEFGQSHAPLCCGRDGLANEHEYPRTSRGTPRGRPAETFDDRNPALFASVWLGTPLKGCPRRANGLRLRRAAETLPASPTVFPIIANPSLESA